MKIEANITFMRNKKVKGLCITKQKGNTELQPAGYVAF